MAKNQSNPETTALTQTSDEPFTTFTFGEGQTVRAIIVGGEPWFVRQDVLDLLDLKSNTSARSLPPDELRTHTMRVNGKLRDLAMVNEPGLYRLVFQSRKKEAEDIKTWVFTKVLPQIREKGYYAHPGLVPGDPAVRELLEVQRQILAVEQERLDIERARHTLARFPEVDDRIRCADPVLEQRGA
jgi:prophage antirepressor-like protein